MTYFYCYTGCPKLSHYQMVKKARKIVLKTVNEIRFIRKIKL